MSIEELDRRIVDLRTGMRQAAETGDLALLRDLGAELREAQAAWEESLARLVPRQQGGPGGHATHGGGRRGSPGSDRPARRESLLPLREQVHHALTLLGVPAAPRLIVAVHAAFFETELSSARLTSLRRDEEKSFRSAPYARPYYLCPALTADRLAPARGLLSISTWSLADRVVGPMSPRLHFLTAAMKVAEAVARTSDPRPEATRLVSQFARGVAGADGTPEAILSLAREEVAVHQEADRIARAEAAKRAGELTDVERLFGVRPHSEYRLSAASSA